MYLRKSCLRSTVEKTTLKSISIVNTERSYANQLFQDALDRIIDIFAKRKSGESFAFSNT